MPSPHKEYGLNSIFQRNFGLETLFHVKHCTFPHFSKNIHILLRCRGTLEAQWEGRYSTHWAELSCLEISPGERSKAEGAEGRALGLILNLCWAEAAAKSPPNISTSQFPLPDQKELEGSPSPAMTKGLSIHSRQNQALQCRARGKKMHYISLEGNRRLLTPIFLAYFLKQIHSKIKWKHASIAFMKHECFTNSVLP